MNLKYDIFAQSVNKFEEQFCGDYYIISNTIDKCRVIVADGLGSGFTANLHATMTAKMISSLVQNGEDPKRVISNAVLSMNRDKDTSTDYCAFLMFESNKSGKVRAFNFNMPDPVFMHCGKLLKVKADTVACGDRHIKILTTNLKSGDTVALFSDGVVNAGIGTSLNLGLGRKNVAGYLSASYKPRITSQRQAQLLLNVCDSLYFKKPSDDYTVAIIKTSVSK